MTQPIEILVVEDNPADAKLTLLALKKIKMANNVQIVQNGDDAVALMKQQGKYADAPKPDLILLDLNLPGKSGHEVLIDIKTDPMLKTIPVVILTTSEDEGDIMRTYQGHANCYITKPIDLNGMVKILLTIQDFWFTVVKLPNGKSSK
jgi:CheY-like chemotaxis protein